MKKWDKANGYIDTVYSFEYPQNTRNVSIINGSGSLNPFYDIKLADLLSKRRHKSITVPRQVGMWLARKNTRYSLEEIGGYFGGRDHTTVMHAVKSIEKKRLDEPFVKDVNLIEESLVNTDS